jgi:hypothetical protein
MAGDLNAKHTGWNCRLIAARGSLLRDYGNTNSRFIYVPDTPTTVPCTHKAMPDVLDKAVHQTAYSARSTDRLPIPIDTSCRPSFQNPLDRLHFTRTDWAAFQP